MTRRINLRRLLEALSDHRRDETADGLKKLWQRVHAHVEHYGQQELDREPLHFPFLVELEHELAALAYPGQDPRELCALPPPPPSEDSPPVYHPGHGP